MRAGKKLIKEFAPSVSPYVLVALSRALSGLVGNIPGEQRNFSKWNCNGGAEAQARNGNFPPGEKKKKKKNPWNLQAARLGMSLQQHKG